MPQSKIAKIDSKLAKVLKPEGSNVFYSQQLLNFSEIRFRKLFIRTEQTKMFSARKFPSQVEAQFDSGL